MIKIATVSIPPLTDPAKNREAYVSYIRQAAEQNVDLIVFPELSLQGYDPDMMAYKPEAGLAHYETAEKVPDGESCRIMTELAKEYQMYIVWGMAEQDPERCEILYNAAVLVGPEGYIGKYRKVHLPGTERLYTSPGDSYHVYNTPIGKIGLMICYDRMFPEAARCLRLMGAEIIVCPTAWPCGAADESDYSLSIYLKAGDMRAIENNVFLVDSNAISEETPEGLEAGHARIVDPCGNTLASTGFKEGMVTAEVDVQYEISKCVYASMATVCNYIEERRPDAYDALLIRDKK